MFNDSKYTKWYWKLIESARNRSTIEGSYYESHHIIPKSLGGHKTALSNRVNLLAREHYIAHLLLTKMCIEPKHRTKMALAAHRVATNTNKNGETYYVNSRLYEVLKVKANIARIGRKDTPEMRAKKSASMKASPIQGNWKRTPEYIDRWKENRKRFVGAGCGERNAMADPEKRAKVGASKVGKKLYSDGTSRKYFVPGCEPESFIIVRR